MSFLVIHGPNLNMLGQRDQSHYGSLTLDEVNQHILDFAKKNDFECTLFQSNSEVEILEVLQNSADLDGIVINPAAFTHTSVAIRDAIETISTPCVEVHLSNVYKREEFRHTSYTAPVCVGKISGFGWRGYLMALDYLIQAH
ncbi:MAG: type II 3-dehydroquinate dehydratase [Candidatus Margulisiibacteriota bacterium]|nr:type II 3-dehydroquinate dehydratase [Candidatus Margulisiibacteriota bacterium]